MRGQIGLMTDAGVMAVIEALLNRRWVRVTAGVPSGRVAEFRDEIRMFNREIRMLRKALKARHRSKPACC